MTLREAREALADKEREIAELRGESAEPDHGGPPARCATVTVPAPLAADLRTRHGRRGHCRCGAPTPRSPRSRHVTAEQEASGASGEAG